MPEPGHVVRHAAPGARARRWLLSRVLTGQATMQLSPQSPGYPRELLRPWKLLSFALGMGWLLYGATHYHIGDWDIGISLIMGTLTYLTAPWCIRQLRRPALPGLPLALLAAWFSIDGSYVVYNSLLQHPMLRFENFCASSALYFLCGLLWLYPGSLRQLGSELRNLASPARPGPE